MTPSERDRRYFAIRECGCIACLMQGIRNVAPQVHHLNEGDVHGGRRLGDDHTVGLCPWHHVGQPICGLTGDECRERLGPSWELEPDAFRVTFGLGVELLAYQERLLKAWRESCVSFPESMAGAA